MRDDQEAGQEPTTYQATTLGLGRNRKGPILSAVWMNPSHAATNGAWCPFLCVNASTDRVNVLDHALGRVGVLSPRGLI